jgi:Flp pilus assembly protein TadG
MKNKRKDSGMASTEIALIMLFVLVPVMLCLVEGGRAFSTYSTLTEASRAAARQVVLTGETGDVDQLVRAVADTLDPEALTADVNLDADNNIVTVEVAYDYDWMLGQIAQDSGYETVTFRSSASMPVP